MTMLDRLTREPAMVLAVFTTGLSAAVLFGLPITAEQVGGVGLFISAVLTLVRYLTVPAKEVLAQRLPNGEIVAGAASAPPTGGQLVGPGGGKYLPINSLGEPVVSVPIEPDQP
jgi:hypothetical protein